MTECASSVASNLEASAEVTDRRREIVALNAKFFGFASQRVRAMRFGPDVQFREKIDWHVCSCEEATSDC
jgi:hypothetical protein